MNRSLLFLALRRTLHPALVATTGLLVALAARTERAPRWVEELGDPGAAAGLARAGVWTLAALLLAPALLALAARASGRWRAEEADWLAPRARGPGTALVSAWLGGLLGALALALLPLVAGELAAGGAGSGWRAAGELALEDPRPVEDGAGLRWLVPDPGARASEGAAVRFELELSARAGPAADVRVRARRLLDGAMVGERTVERRLARAGALELPLPPGRGALELSLARIGEGATVALRRPAVQLLLPAGSARAAGAALLAHLVLALAAGGALALALGCATGAGTATVLLLGAFGIAALAPAPAGFPGLSFAAALALTRQGLVPPAPPAAAWLGGVAAVLLGLGTARLALARGRAG